MLVLENRIKGGNKEAFVKKVKEISNDLGINPNWLMVVMNAESGIDSKARNMTHLVEGEPATGLIQFVPSTAKGLGTTVDALYNMSNVEQLDYVKKFFEPYKSKILQYHDLYLVTFFPIGIGKPDDWVFEAKGINRNSVAKSNPVIDLNKDGIITIKEFKDYALSKVPAEYRDSFKNEEKDSVMKFTTRHKEFILGVLALIVAGVLLYKYFVK